MRRAASFVCVAMLCITMLPLDVFAGTTTYSSYTEVLGNGYKGYYMRETGTTDKGVICYCYQHENKQPPTEDSESALPGFIKEDYLTTADTQADCKNKREAIAAVLYAGYPTDGCGYREKYGISEDDARKNTQEAVWAISGGDEDLSMYNGYAEPYDNYYLAIMCYAAKMSSYYGQSADLTLNGSTQLGLTDGAWKTGTLSVSGTFLGSIKLPTSTDVAFYDSTSNAKVTSVKVGDSFYAKYVGDGQPSGVYELSGSFITAKSTDFYATNDIWVHESTGESKLYQDMVSMLPKTEKLSMNIIKDAPTGNAKPVTPAPIQPQAPNDTTEDVTSGNTEANETEELTGAAGKEETTVSKETVITKEASPKAGDASPKTGDASGLNAYVILFLMCGAAMLFAKAGKSAAVKRGRR